MSSDHGLVMPLEQSCIRPGFWLIEGYEVRRLERNLWSARNPGRHEFTARTLRAVREIIADRIEQGAR